MDEPQEPQTPQGSEAAFIAQMRHRRSVLGLSQGELAERVVAMGGSMYQQTIAKLESGLRSLKLSEADVLARALGTTAHEMLSEVAPPERRWADSRNVVELEKEVESALQDLDMAREQEAAAAQRAAAAVEARAAAQVEATLAQNSHHSAREMVSMLQLRYERLVGQLHTWREVERRTGKSHRPRKRGEGFVELKDPLDDDTKGD